jgi:hypothetical protein
MTFSDNMYVCMYFGVCTCDIHTCAHAQRHNLPHASLTDGVFLPYIYLHSIVDQYIPACSTRSYFAKRDFRHRHKKNMRIHAYARVLIFLLISDVNCQRNV